MNNLLEISIPQNSNLSTELSAIKLSRDEEALVDGLKNKIDIVRVERNTIENFDKKQPT